MKQSGVLIVLLLTTAITFALDPPVKLWEQQYYSAHDGCFFVDMEQTPSGDLFIAGTAWDYPSSDLDNYCAFLLDTDGNIIWEVLTPIYSLFTYDGSVLSDGSMVITGVSAIHPDSSESLFIIKIDQAGSVEWTKNYDYPDTKEEGYGITCLPDGGFAVCGRVHGTGFQQGEAWILRTDSQGDTLWTQKWQTEGLSNSFNYGKSILLSNNELCTLTSGLSDSLPTFGPHLLFYDLDGNFLRGTDYPSLYYEYPAGMCSISDGGYTFVTKTTPEIWHTDQFGNPLWWYSIYVTPNDEHESFCIRPTMDNGYIFSGWDGYYEYEPDGNLIDYEEGWLVRFDSEGNELWNINNNVSVNNHFYSVLQLPQGGYVACGTWPGSGYVVRYAPETGIEQPEPAPGIQMSISPNPCNSVLSVEFAQSDVGLESVRIFDLSGREVSVISDELLPAGNSSFTWAVPEHISAGCYLVHAENSLVSVTESLVLLR